MSAGITAAVVAGGAAIAGAAISASGSKSAARGQADAASGASEAMLQAGRDANEIVDRAYTKNQPQIAENYGLARQDLAQYAGLGGGAANQLAQLLGIRNEYNKPVLKLPEKQYADKTGKQRTVFIKKYQDELKLAKAVYAKQLEAWSKKQNAPKGGSYGELLRSFNRNDYMRDPTTGGKAPIDLTRNLSLIDYKKDLITGGKAPIDLTRNFTLADFKADPGYEFRQRQGNLGVERSGAARGMQLSGATMKALQRFGQNLASDEYDRASDRFNVNRQNAFNVFNDVSNRFNMNRQNAAGVYGDVFNRYTGQKLNRFNLLNSMLGQGQNAASGRANISQSLSNQLTGTSQQRSNLMSQNLLNAAGAGAGYSTDAATANAAGQVGASNALNQGISGVANAAMDYSALRNSSYKQPQPYMSMRNTFNGWGV